ncbi:non-specific lipid transfer protein GPI-anchored 3-like [Musa acuminata AAA Group]|uniref:non-specific lipid transfer protein GPI-anchored 3-like n=1 Tax=Musa acuminata AAA Group TaxID=214697 RepID=UPI0031D1029D
MKLLLLLLVTSWASAAPSQNGGASGVPVCLSKLMPCVSFLHSSEQPTVVCCIPLKFALANDVDCLCDIFYSQELLQTFNVTRQAVRDLPPRCGLRPIDLGKCNNSSASQSSPLPSLNVTSPPKGTPSGSLGLRMSIINVVFLTLIGFCCFILFF